MSRFFGKTLCVVGGSGYIGQAVTRAALSKGINVLSVSRSGNLTDKDLQQVAANQPQKLQVVRGDANTPENFGDSLLKSDAIVHTIGTLVDTSITKGRNPGEPGTYEHMNRDCLINIAQFLESQKVNKKIVYTSASLAPPFIPRYLTTKQEAENYLLQSQYLSTTILKPGFVFSKEHRLWSMGLKYEVDLWAQGFTLFYNKCVPTNTYMHSILKNLIVDRSVDLKDVSQSAVYAAFNKDLDGKLLFNDDIEQNSLYYRLDVARTEQEVRENQEGEQRIKQEQERQVKAEQERLQKEQQQLKLEQERIEKQKQQQAKQQEKEQQTQQKQEQQQEQQQQESKQKEKSE